MLPKCKTNTTKYSKEGNQNEEGLSARGKGAWANKSCRIIFGKNVKLIMRKKKSGRLEKG